MGATKAVTARKTASRSRPKQGVMKKAGKQPESERKPRIVSKSTKKLSSTKAAFKPKSTRTPAQAKKKATPKKSSKSATKRGAVTQAAKRSSRGMSEETIAKKKAVEKKAKKLKGKHLPEHPQDDVEALALAEKAKEEGKAPSTQAGSFVHEEMEKLKHGDPTVRSRAQAVAIGLSKARKYGIAIPDKRG